MDVQKEKARPLCRLGKPPKEEKEEKALGVWAQSTAPVQVSLQVVRTIVLRQNQNTCALPRVRPTAALILSGKVGVWLPSPGFLPRPHF